MTPFPGTLTTQIVEHHFTTKTGRDGCQRSHTIVLTPEQKAWFVRWFPTVENDRLMQASGLRFGTLHRLARQLGLKKSAKGLHGIMVRHGARVKKKLTESGFYDTLRGIAPSDACRQAGKQYWQEVKEGKRPSPMRSLKAKDPKRYRQLMQKRGEYRKELMRRETAPEVWPAPSEPSAHHTLAELQQEPGAAPIQCHSPWLHPHDRLQRTGRRAL